jgi:RsiW-degrading membrane proteinase PrsW (M82 family)
MILWFTVLLVGAATLAGLLCVALGLGGRKPADLTIIALVVVEVLLLAQIVIAVIAPAVGNSPSGNPVEFWLYLITAAVIPPLAVLWALTDRTRWSTVVLGVGALAVAVMSYRMYQIWTVQLA